MGPETSNLILSKLEESANPELHSDLIFFVDHWSLAFKASTRFSNETYHPARTVNGPIGGGTNVFEYTWT